MRKKQTSIYRATVHTEEVVAAYKAAQSAV